MATVFENSTQVTVRDILEHNQQRVLRRDQRKQAKHVGMTEVTQELCFQQEVLTALLIRCLLACFHLENKRNDRADTATSCPDPRPSSGAKNASNTFTMSDSTHDPHLPKTPSTNSIDKRESSRVDFEFRQIFACTRFFK